RGRGPCRHRSGPRRRPPSSPRKCGWVRTSKNGKRYLSLSVKPKQDKPPVTNKSRAGDFGTKLHFRTPLMDRAAEATVELLLYPRRRGGGEIDQPDPRRRLAALDKRQLKQVCRRVQKFNSDIAAPWSREEVAALVSSWGKLRG